MTYINQVIRRQAPLTKCQCAVLAVLSETFSDVDTIWKRKPVYCYTNWKGGTTTEVAYGTISAVLRSLVQQGFAEMEVRGKKHVVYRTAKQ